MATVTATEFKKRLGEWFDQARREPVTIVNHGRPTHVILDAQEYDRLVLSDDAYWGERAERARADGMLSPEETMNWLQSRNDDSVP